MTFRQYSIVMSLVSLVAWAGWIAVLFLVDPLSAGSLALLLFYFSLAAALVGTLSLFGLLIRLAVFRRRDTVLSKEVSAAFRQSMMITALLVGSLILQRFRLLTWWNSLLLVLVFGLVELFLFTAGTSRRTLPESDGSC
ncbi:hypothetical protein A3D72_02105 [Candidatus Uhrbacteria bacterium RIFCSPHIGHO2_02_FULL_57_19]|uniref:Uncharacterized protein n=1 Tax=Candidatus Uhrbacteria bacterium RIFCSPHIGHO2_02_FULL_57_19 TaxID=1802391 RepID=A0A1F7U612_9BACT|nr:MAG: hypothetical protein A3D72_02105 [Candidatus Uhrbacteria bacterium RIFCSPHIGHO2_02_FULL_57_19]